MKVNKERQIKTMEEESMEHEMDNNRLVGIDMSNPLEAIKAIVAEPEFIYEWQSGREKKYRLTYRKYFSNEV